MDPKSDRIAVNACLTLDCYVDSLLARCSIVSSTMSSFGSSGSWHYSWYVLELKFRLPDILQGGRFMRKDSIIRSPPYVQRCTFLGAIISITISALRKVGTIGGCFGVGNRSGTSTNGDSSNNTMLKIFLPHETNKT